MRSDPDTRPPQLARPRTWDANVLAFGIGAFFAVVQLSYTFLLETYLTSRTVSFFTALACWLVGVLLGLGLRRASLFLPLLATGLGAYYLTWAIIRARPFDLAVLPAALVAVGASGLLAGYFFPWSAERFPRVKLLFLHENNGFLAGTLASLTGFVYYGGRYLLFAPALAALLVIAVYLVFRRGPGEVPG